MRARDEAAAVRAGAGLFRLGDRGLLAVAGADRTRWLDGMLSNDVASLEPGSERSGCPALLLSRKGRLVADLQVLLRPEAFWLEMAAAATASAKAALEAFVVADDVHVGDLGTSFERLALEGSGAPHLLERVLGRPPGLNANACADFEIAGCAVVVAAFGWSGEPAFQLFVPAGRGETVGRAMLAEGASAASAEALEILRIEAGRPFIGAELGPEVLPAEARLERSIAFDKGCYTGQEIVARIESRARLTRRLVGLRFEGEAPPGPGADLERDGAKVGTVTSVCVSPSAGPIGLGYVKVAWEAPGTELRGDGWTARVAELPLVPAVAQLPLVGAVAQLPRVPPAGA